MLEPASPPPSLLFFSLKKKKRIWFLLVRTLATYSGLLPPLLPPRPSLGSQPTPCTTRQKKVCSSSQLLSREPTRVLGSPRQGQFDPLPRALFSPVLTAPLGSFPPLSAHLRESQQRLGWLSKYCLLLLEAFVEARPSPSQPRSRCILGSSDCPG